MPDTPDLRAYVAALEAAFTRARGREHVLSPHDFALARAWHASGVPLALVLDEVARTSPQAGSLAYLRRGVEARAKTSATAGAAAALQTAPAPAAPSERADLAAARAWLDGLRVWLAAPEASAEFGALRASVASLDDDLSHEPPPDVLRSSLAALDVALAEAALRACGPARVAHFRQEAARAVARQRGRLDDEALEEALRRYERRRARELLGIPERG